jgi:AcrR family transcriptional regulator
VNRLEEEIGLSRGAIFNYFPDKWSLFFELASRDQNQLLTMLADEGLDATLRYMTTENPDWMAVYIEITRHLRRDPKLLEEFQQRGSAELDQRVTNRFRSLYDGGAFRRDVPFEEVVHFINVVATARRSHGRYASSSTPTRW